MYELHKYCKWTDQYSAENIYKSSSLLLCSKAVQSYLCLTVQPSVSNMIKHESGRPTNGFLTYGLAFYQYIYKWLHIANVNVFNIHGQTPLHTCKCKCCIDNKQLLNKTKKVVIATLWVFRGTTQSELVQRALLVSPRAGATRNRKYSCRDPGIPPRNGKWQSSFWSHCLLHISALVSPNRKHMPNIYRVYKSMNIGAQQLWAMLIQDILLNAWSRTFI